MQIKKNIHKKNKKIIRKKTSLVTWIMFLSTLVVVLVSLTPTIFPALLLRMFGGFDNISGINPFEIGEWTIPLLLTNIILFSLVFLHIKNRLFQPITKAVKFVFNFEISEKVSALVIVVLIGFYVTFSVGELIDNKFQPDFLHLFKFWLDNYSVTSVESTPLTIHVQLFLLDSSTKLFGNYEVVPFIASIALLVLTYFFTAELSQKRFAGIIAMVIVLQSNVFLMYDNTVSYPNFWILFYLLSLYLIIKKWPLSPIAWVASIFSKALSAAFLPMTLFFVYRENISIKKKIRIALSYGFIVTVGLLFLLFIGENIINTGTEFGTHDFVSGLTAAYLGLRFDGLILVFMIPLVLGLFAASKKGIRHADSIMFLIMGILLSAPFVQAFSGTINVPYRFIPLVVFFAIGTGLLLSKGNSKSSLLFSSER